MRKNAGGIGPGFKLRFRAIGAHGFHHEVRARSAQQSAGIAATGPQPVIRTIRKFADLLDQFVALDIGIQHVSGAHFQRDFPASTNGIDGDDGGSAGNPRALNGA